MKLYVDCDDTLVRWKDALEGRLTTEWEPNETVIAYVHDWRSQNPTGELVIWSTGGQEYAADWARKILPGLAYSTESKWPVIPQPGDVFLDDMPMEPWARASIHPKQLEALR